MTRRDNDSIVDRLDSIEDMLDRVDRRVERIEIVTIVRDPASDLAADAYEGLRRQVIAAASERVAHLAQLAQFHAAFFAGASAEQLGRMVAEWMGQASLELVEDPQREGVYEYVGSGDLSTARLVRPAYVDAATGRVIRGGVVELAGGNGAADSALAATKDDKRR